MKEGFDEFLYIQRAIASCIPDRKILVKNKVVLTPFPQTVIIVSITASEKNSNNYDARKIKKKWCSRVNG